MADSRENLRQVVIAATLVMVGAFIPPALGLLRSEVSSDVRLGSIEEDVKELVVERNKGGRWTTRDQAGYDREQDAIHVSMVARAYEHSAECNGNWREVSVILRDIDKRLEKAGI